MDGSGNVYVVGQIMNTSSYMDMAFLAKFTTNGTQLWNRTWTDEIYDYGEGVAVDASGNAYVVGQSNAGYAFLLKYATNGTPL